MMANKKKKNRKALPHDPFEDMGALDWIDHVEDGFQSLETAELLANAIAGEGMFHETLSGENIDVAETTDLEPETKTGVKVRSNADDGSEFEEVIAASFDHSDKIEPDHVAEDELVTEAEQITADRSEEIEAPDVLSAEEAVQDTGSSKIGENQTLDELIAIIDEEIDETFGSSAMTETLLDPLHSVTEEQYVIFNLSGTEYAVPISNVTEIGNPLGVTPVPNVPDWMLGVANLRGDVTSVIDLRIFLGMEPAAYEKSSRMMVAQTREEELKLGLIVDRVSGISFLDREKMGPPTNIDDQISPYLVGTHEQNGRLLVALDLEKLLLSSQIRQFEPV